MNASNAKDYLPLVQALADGKTLQIKDPRNLGAWIEQDDFSFSCEPGEYRIKPEPKKGWYRVAMFKEVGEESYTLTIDHSDHASAEQNFSGGRAFIRWLTPRIEYEITE